MIFDFVKYMQKVSETFTEFTAEAGDKVSRVSSIAGLEEFLSTLSRNSKGLHLIVVTTNDGVIQDPARTDNYMDVPFYRFYVVGHAKLSDHDEKEILTAKCKQVGKKIITKMLKDRSTMKNGLTGLDFSRIPYLGIGPFGNNYYGLSFSFSVSDDAGLEANLISEAEDFTIE